MSYINSTDYNHPQQWIYRIRGYLGVLSSLSHMHYVISIEQINYTGEHLVNGVHHYFFNNGKKVTYFPNSLHQRLRKLMPDVVIVHGLHFPLQILQLRISLGKKVRIIVQDHANRIPKWYKKPIQLLADRCINAYFFSSAVLAKEWYERGLIRKKEKIKEIMVGSSVFTPMDKATARKKLGLEEALSFIWVGKLDFNKDPLTLIKAFIEFSKIHTHARLYVIYQENDLLKEVKELIGCHGIKNISLVGKVLHEDLDLWFNSADYVVSTSHKEAFGFAIAEAMSCGCIPVVTDIPSFQKITGHSCGVLFEPGNVSGLVRALEEVTKRDIVNEREKTIQQFNRHLSFDAIASNISRVVQSL